MKSFEDVMKSFDDLINRYAASLTFNRYAEWKLSFSFLPRKCDLTEKIIWLEYAYKGRLQRTMLEDYVYEVRWHRKNDHLIWALKQ